MLKKLSWLLAAIMIIGLCGCESGSSESDDEYDSWTFVNRTDKHIQITRNGGTEWKGDESFDLDHNGERRTVDLEEKGTISYTYFLRDSGEIKDSISGNEIFFDYD